MDNVSITSKVFEKKAEGYSFQKNNYVSESELTVTITLGEYRELVSGIATKVSDIAAANADKYSRESQIKALTEENNKLKSELYELKKALEEKASE